MHSRSGDEGGEVSTYVGKDKMTRGCGHLCSRSQDGNRESLSSHPGKRIALNKGHRTLEDLENELVRGRAQNQPAKNWEA